MSPISRNPGWWTALSSARRGAVSEVLNDPKAFLFDKEKDILVLPVELAGTYRTCSRQGITTAAASLGRGVCLLGRPGPWLLPHGEGEALRRAIGIPGPGKEGALHRGHPVHPSPRVIYMSDLGDGVSYLNDVNLV